MSEPPSAPIFHTTSAPWWRRYAGLLTVACCGLLLIVLLWRYEPAETSWFPKCVFYQWTGIHCPGCGGTRAVSALLHGDIYRAVRMNPLLVLGGPVIALLIWRQRRRERRYGIVDPRLGWSLVLVVVTYFVARNIPSPTRSWLAPPASTSRQVSEDRSAMAGSHDRDPTREQGRPFRARLCLKTLHGASGVPAAGR